MSFPYSREEQIDHIAKTFRANPTAEELQRLCEANPSLEPTLRERLDAELLVIFATKRVEHWTRRRTTSSKRAKSPAKQFGDFTLLEPLGKGGYATVYRARRASSDLDVAVKILSSRWSKDAEAVARFHNEADVHRLVKHPNIVPILESGCCEDRPFLVMPFISGPDLGRIAKDARLDPDRAAKYIRAAALACDALHRKGVIHRDIKPANILTQHGEIYLTDFGLARLPNAEYLTRGSSDFGTLGFRAPEQIIESFGKLSRATDVYALGATLYFLLKGRAPFVDIPAATKSQVALRIAARGVSAPIRDDEEIPPPLRRICNRCLETFPEDRYQTADQLAEDLRKFLSNEAVRPRRPSFAKRVVNLKRLHPRSAKFAFAITVIAAASITWFAGKAGISDAERSSLQQRQLAQQYDADMRTVQEFLEDRRIAEAQRMLAKYESGQERSVPRGFEWEYLRRAAAVPPPIDLTAGKQLWERPAFSRSGNRLALINTDGVTTVFDGKSWAEEYRLSESALDVSFGADDRLLAILLDAPVSRVEVRDASDGSSILQFAQDSGVTAIAFHPTEEIVYTGHSDGSIQGWRLDISNKLAVPSRAFATRLHDEIQNPDGGESPVPDRFRPIESAVTALSYPSDQTVFSGYENGRIRVWKLSKADETVSEGVDRERLRNGDSIIHRGPVTGFAVHPRRGLFVTQSAGEYDARDSRPGDLRVWGSDEIVPTRSYSPHAENLSYPRHEGEISWKRALRGRLVPVISNDGLLYSTSDQGVAIWDLNVRGGPIDFLATGRPVMALASAPGRVVAVSDVRRATAFSVRERYDGQVAWRPDSAHMTIEGMSLHGKLPLLALSMRATVGEITLRLAQRPPGFAPVIFQITDLSTGERVFDAVEWAGKVFADTQRAFAPPVIFDSVGNARFGGHKIRLQDEEAMAGQRLRWLGIDEFCSEDESVTVRVPFSSPHGEILSSSNGAATAVRIGEHEKPICCIAVATDGSCVVTSSLDGTTSIWSRGKGDSLRTAKHSSPALSIALGSNNEIMAVGLDDGTIELWDLPAVERIATLPRHKRSVTGLTFIPNQSRLVSCSGVGISDTPEAGQVFIWDLSTRRLCLELKSQRSNVYSSIAVSPDGNSIYAAANSAATLTEGQVLVWKSVVD